MVYGDCARSQELLHIQLKERLSFKHVYEVQDRPNGIFIGTLRRNLWSAELREEWEILDCQQRMVGRILEDNAWSSFWRRMFLTMLLPASFRFEDTEGRLLAMAHRRFRQLVIVMDLEFNPEAPMSKVDPRLIAVATGLLTLYQQTEYS